MIQDEEDFTELDSIFEDFDFDDEEKDYEDENILGAKDLVQDYTRVFPSILEAHDNGGPFPLAAQVLVDRAYALLQAFLSADKKTKISKEKETKKNAKGISLIKKINVLVEFFNFEETTLPKINKSDLQEVITKLKALSVDRHQKDQMEVNCKGLHLQKNRLAALKQLMHLRYEADKCSKAFTLDTKRGMFTGEIRFQAYYRLFCKNINEATEKLTDIIVGLLGSVFKRTFTKDELIRDYGYPNISDDEFYMLRLEDLGRKGITDTFQAMFF